MKPTWELIRGGGTGGGITRILPLLICLLCAPLAIAQTAKVIALSPADAAEAKTLYAQREALDKKIADLREKITQTYLSEQHHENTAVFKAYKPGWGSNFLYSEDFRFIVPNSSSTISGTLSICGACCSPSWLGGATLTATPAVGTFVNN